MIKPTNLKLLLLILFLLLGTMVLSGCGSDKSKAPSAPSSPSPVAPAPSPASPAENEKAPDEKEIVSGLINKGKEIKEMSYDMVMIGAGLSSESKVWLKGTMMKTDSTFNGQRIISIFDSVNGEVISYLPGDNMATKMKIEEYPGQDSTTPIDYTQQLNKADIRPAGNETINGMECKVLTIISVEGSCKQWLSTDYGIVVKVEEDLHGQGITIEYKNIEVGQGSVSNDTLKLPEGMEVIDPNTGK